MWPGIEPMESIIELIDCRVSGVFVSYLSDYVCSIKTVQVGRVHPVVINYRKSKDESACSQQHVGLPVGPEQGLEFVPRH